MVRRKRDDIERFVAMAEELERSGDGLHRFVMTGMKASLAPIATRARARYLTRPTFGVKAASTVRIEYSTNSITMGTGARDYPWGATEFGANIVTTVRGQKIDYSKRFGRHLGATGYAFVPAVRLGLRRANDTAAKQLDEITGRVARAAGGR